MRQIQIFVTKDKHSEIVEFLQDTLGLSNLFSVRGDTNAQISLRVSESQSSKIVQELKNIGVGVEYGLIDVIQLVVSVPLIVEDKEDLVETALEARVVTEELYRSIATDARISMDYLWFIMISALVAGLGILQNSGITVVASMLLAPLMGPILGFSLSTVVKDQQLTKDSLIAEGSGLGIALICGLVLGLLTSHPTQLPEQMTARGNPGSIDLLIALLSGLAVAYALGRGATSSLVGVAIAASLMPPAVNVGIAIMWGEGSIAIGSLVLVLANIILIDLAAIVMFRILKIQPVGMYDATWTGLSTEQVGGRFSRLFGRKKKKSTISSQENGVSSSASEVPENINNQENAGIFAKFRKKDKIPVAVSVTETTDISTSDSPKEDSSDKTTSEEMNSEEDN